MRRRSAATIALLFAPTLLFAQAQPPAGPPPAGPPPVVKPATPPVAPKPADDEPKPPPPPEPIVDDTGNATRLVAENQKPLADKDPKVRAAALKAFAIHRNEAYAKVVAPLLHDKDEDVARAAVAALGNQPFPAATDALVRFVSDEKKGAPTEVLTREAIRALGNIGIGKKGYEPLRAIFEKLDDEAKNELFATFVRLKEKRAFSLMVEHVDEPKFSGANRPPASVQKIAFDTWKACRETVRKGLKEMTGEGFATAKQYIDWSEGAGRKHGFAYEHGK